MFGTIASQAVRLILESDDEEDFKDVSLPPKHVEGIHDDLFTALTQLGVSADRISSHYSDTLVMCRTHQEAHTIVNAGPWKSMAQVVRTNPDHPDAKQFPWLADIPFANLSGYISNKIKRP